MKRIMVLAGVLAALAAAPAAAQTLGIDAAFNSRYEWRGVTYTNNWVIQPDAYLSFGAGPATITAGGWGNVELGAYDGSDDISENGLGSAGLTEFDWWAEAAFPVGKATITGGATGYIFPGDKADGGFSSDNNTTEIYGKASLGVLLNPSFAIWYDVDAIKGSYMEFAVSHGIPLGATEITLGALMGLSAGQKQTATEAGNFADDGITHFDFSAKASFGAGPLSITPNVHLIVGQDNWTKIAEPNDYPGYDASTKFWFGATVSWSHGFGSSKEE